MSAEWAARPSQPIEPTSTNQKAHFAPVNLSLMHFIQNIKVPPILSLDVFSRFSCNFRKHTSGVLICIPISMGMVPIKTSHPSRHGYDFILFYSTWNTLRSGLENDIILP
jgi:hypothetical protein